MIFPFGFALGAVVLGFGLRTAAFDSGLDVVVVGFGFAGALNTWGGATFGGFSYDIKLRFGGRRFRLSIGWASGIAIYRFVEQSGPFLPITSQAKPDAISLTIWRITRDTSVKAPAEGLELSDLRKAYREDRIQWPAGLKEWPKIRYGLNRKTTTRPRRDRNAECSCRTRCAGRATGQIERTLESADNQTLSRDDALVVM